MGALDFAVRSGKARYVGISSYSGRRTEEAIEILRSMGTPLLIHQPSYSMFNRWIESDLLDVVGREGVGVIAFSPLAQGLLTDKYLGGIPQDSRVRRGQAFDAGLLTDENVARARALNEIAAGRGQTLAQLAIAWVLRDPRVTSALIGASSVAQLEQNVAALDGLEFDAGELEAIERARRRRADQHLGVVERRLARGHSGATSGSRGLRALASAAQPTRATRATRATRPRLLPLRDRSDHNRHRSTSVARSCGSVGMNSHIAAPSAERRRPGQSRRPPGAGPRRPGRPDPTGRSPGRSARCCPRRTGRACG